MPARLGARPLDHVLSVALESQGVSAFHSKASIERRWKLALNALLDGLSP